MLSKHSKDQRELLEVFALSELVPEDHLVRKIEEAMDFSFIYEKVAPLYSSKGRPSIDPVVLIKMVLIQYVFGHRSMRETIKRIETDVAYRWFIGYGFSEKIPHFSTFSKTMSAVFMIRTYLKQSSIKSCVRPWISVLSTRRSPLSMEPMSKPMRIRKSL
ncbi:hypothetical protein DJ88_2604 [Bacillus paralicheniformis]|nr:hypothetical protein DJ88_2604 [Bacillus paralicheniformis]